LVNAIEAAFQHRLTRLTTHPAFRPGPGRCPNRSITTNTPKWTGYEVVLDVFPM
jgi:hypothetical protein